MKVLIWEVLALLCACYLKNNVPYFGILNVWDRMYGIISTYYQEHHKEAFKKNYLFFRKVIS